MFCAIIKVMNEELVLRLARDEARLRSVCLILNKVVNEVNLLDAVNYGINHPVSLRTINERINAGHINARSKSKKQSRMSDSS